MLDTGASTTGTLSPAIFNDLAQKGMLKTLKQSKVLTVSGISTRQVGRVQFLAVKASIVRNPVVKMSDSNLLGLGFWSRHVATFDFPNKVIYLREGVRFKEPDRYDLSGLHLLRIVGAAVVHSVDNQSRAATAGIEANDVIVKINDQMVEQRSMFAIRRILSVEGDEVATTANRREEEFDVAFSLRKCCSSHELGSTN